MGGDLFVLPLRPFKIFTDVVGKGDITVGSFHPVLAEPTYRRRSGMNHRAVRGRRWRIVALLLPYLLLVFVHMLSGIEAEQPLILADELGYLGNARYLAGTAHLPDMWQTQFYHFGYSLLLVPAFWLLSDPISIYKAAIFLNALMAAALYFPVYFILGSFLEVSKSTARWIAFTCCLYPPILLYSNFALSESAFIPFYALVVALFGRALVSRLPRDAVLFGLATGCLYAIHPRALPILATTGAYLLVLAFLRVLPKKAVLLSAATMGGVFAVARLVNGHLKVVGWGGGGEFSAVGLAARLVPGSGFDLARLIKSVLGQFLYLFQASHGLFVVGLAATVWLIVTRRISGTSRRVLAEPSSGVPIFVLITALGVFAASCSLKLYSIHGPEGLRAADLIHGRYNEAAAVLFLAFGLAEYSRRRLRRRQLIGAAIAVVVTILCVTQVVAVELADAHRRHDRSVTEEVLARGVQPDSVDAINVPGVFPLVVMAGELDLFFMSVATLASFLILTLTMRFSMRAGMGLLMLLFAVFSLYNYRQYLVPEKARARPRLTFVSQLRRLAPIGAISYDMAHREDELHYGIQYLLQNTVFDRFHSDRGERPSSQAVISGNNWPQARQLGARFVVSSGWDNALWALPGEMQSHLPEAPYEGVTLGAEPTFGVQESGFHPPEVFVGAPQTRFGVREVPTGRWTNGAASLKVPVDPLHPPRLLAIETIAPGRQGATLQVLANGVELWSQPIPADPWSKTFALQGVPLDDSLLIELKSDRSPDDRSLGVVVREIRLTARDPAAAGAFEGLTLGTHYVLGFEESGFHGPELVKGEPGRWTNGAASLRVPLHPQSRPRLLEIDTFTAGQDGVRLQVLANGAELWHQRIPHESWSKTFSLEQVPMGDELLIELKSDTFSPADTDEQSLDERRLGVAVRGVRLTARDRFISRERTGL